MAPNNISVVNVSSKMMIPKEILDTGTKYVTNEELIGPMRLINLINIT